MTTYFIRRWLRSLAGFVPTLMGERALLGMTWSFFLMGLLTVLIFLERTTSICEDWRSVRRCGYCARCAIMPPDHWWRPPGASS